MPPGNPFTTAEDTAIWKIAIENEENADGIRLGRLFKKKMASERTPPVLLNRFQSYLLPHLQNTKFHTETKLKLCQMHRIQVEHDFLEELEKEADIKLDKRCLVKSFKLKRTCRANEDMQLNDEEFTQITSPIISKSRQYSFEDDIEICRYVLANHETFDRGPVFWGDLSERFKRPSSILSSRFLYKLVPKLSEMNFPVEDALKLYKCCQIAVDEDYLKELKKLAEVEINEKGCITGYKLKDGRAEKRKSTEESEGSAKKARGSGSEEADESDEEESTGNEDAEELAGEDQEEEEEMADEPENAESGTSGQPAENGNDEVLIVVPETIVPKQEPIDDVQILEAPVVPPKEAIAALVPEPETNASEAFLSPEQEQMIFGGNELAFTAEEIVEEKKDVPSGSDGMMEKAMQSFEGKLKKDLEEIFDAKMSKMQAELEVSALKNLEVSIKTQMLGMMARGVEYIQGKMKSIGTDSNHETSSNPTTSIRKNCLINLKKLLSSLNSPETAEIEQKIESVLNTLPEVDERPFPPEMITTVVATAHRFVNSFCD